MNDLLVVPPEGFQITLLLDSAGGSAIDTASLSLVSDQEIGAHAAGLELGPLFQVDPTRAVWEIPAGSDLARTTHNLLASIADAAGNVAEASYGFAVRDFAYGPPLGNLQTIFLDFDQDRSLGPEIDFLEDLRSFGLSSSADPAIESLMRDRLVGEIVARVHPYYGRESEGSPGPDAANVVFVEHRARWNPLAPLRGRRILSGRLVSWAPRPWTSTTWTRARTSAGAAPSSASSPRPSTTSGAERPSSRRASIR